MKFKLLNALTAAILFFTPNVIFAQTPTLGNAAKFVLFTTNGAMTCSGTKYLTHLTGNVGSNLPGSVTGFGNVDGVMHTADGTAGLCVPDVISLYTQLSTAIPTNTLATPFGSGATLFAGTYSLVTASTLTGNLILDGQGNPNAQFIFQIGGVFTTNALSRITLINGALACNVFWQVGGAVNVGTGTYMRGTIVANGQIDLTSTLDTLEGRALALNAAVLVSQLVAYTPIGCGSALLTGPAAPAMLDSTATYGVFSSIGAVTSTPITYVIGNVGGNSTGPTGFNPLNVIGTIHSMDPSTAAAAADLTNIYNYLVALPADILLLDPSDFGHGLVLTPHSYQVTGITQLTGNLILNAEGDANAVFVIKINGSFTTGSLSRIMLINGAQAKNVYWKVDGAVDIFSNSVFNGTLVVAGAISLETGDTLNGRALSTNGAVAINGSYVKITPNACAAPAIGGVLHACKGRVSALTDPTVGGNWSSFDTTIASIDSNSGTATGVRQGNTQVTYVTTSGCVATAIFTVNGIPSPIIGLSSVCVGDSVILTDTTSGGIWSTSNSLLASVGSASGHVKGLAAGIDTILYTIATGCAATRAVTVNAANAGVIAGPSTVCVGSAITLMDPMPGGVWSSSNASATVVGGTVTGVVSGVDTIKYTVINVCGTAVATKTITVNAMPNSGIITGLSTVCVGSTITLTDLAVGGTWSASNANATVGSTGIVTGVIPGADTISYAVTNLCGTAVATKTITVNSMTGPGTILGSSFVCVGSSITLTDAVPGGSWSSSNANASVGTTGVVTGFIAGVDTIGYTISGGCSSGTATKTITIDPLPNAGSISGSSSVCVGSSITLTESVTGGTWSSSNANASVGTTGIVTGNTAGTDIISYTVTSTGCVRSATSAITVNPMPSAGIITGASSVCVSSSTTLTESTMGGVWSCSNATASVGTTGVVTGIISGVDTIRYTVINLGCTSPSATKTITINPLPNAGGIAGAASVCVNATITLTDSVSGGTWSNSNTNASVSTSGVVSGVAAGTVIIKYAVTNGCGSDTAIRSVVVDPLPNAGSISGAAKVCIGSSITLTDAITGGVWSSSNASATVSSTGIVTGTISGTAIIRYAVTNVCGTDTAMKAITTNVLPLTPVISTQAPSSACTGTMYQNFGTATPPQAGSVYEWTATGSVVWAEGTLHQYALVNFGSQGTAYVTLSTVITGTQCASSNTVVVNVGASVSQTPLVSYFNDHFVCTPNNEGSYQWGYDDVHTLDSTILAGEINEDYVNSAPDYTNKDYWVMTTTGGCLQKTYYRTPTTVQNANQVTGISVYPDPARSIINVEISSTDNSSIRVDVLNMMGQRVITANTAYNKTVLDVNDLPAGSYIISCYRNDFIIAHARFIKN